MGKNPNLERNQLGVNENNDFERIFKMTLISLKNEK